MIPRSASALAFAASLFGLAGCGQPTHLQYDYGRSFQAAFVAQADLSRPSAAHGDYPLSGVEGLALRQAVTKTSTDVETTKEDSIK